MRQTHACTWCDGRGGECVEEPDEPTTYWTCEGCLGSGLTTSCRDCADPMPVPEYDRQHGYCALCLAERERSDRDVYVEQLRRMG